MEGRPCLFDFEDIDVGWELVVDLVFQDFRGEHRVYFKMGDLSEGVSHEAASLAGHLGLGRLVYVYDDNHISIDGPTELALTDDAVRRFEAYGWQVIQLGEAAEDLDAMRRAARQA